MSSAWVARSMARTRGLTASYRPLALTSASMPERRSVSLAAVNTLAPSGIRSPTRVRAAATSSRISTAKPCADSAAAARSSRAAGAGSAKDTGGGACVPGAGAAVPGAEPASGVVSRYRTS